MNNWATEFVEKNCRSVPWGSRSSWHGSLLSHDGTDTKDITEADIDDGPEQEIGWYANGVNAWDGDCAVVLRLKDGRWMAYESSWGPTGSGFSEDAYGGDADLVFAASKDNAVKFGISEAKRPALRWEKRS